MVARPRGFGRQWRQVGREVSPQRDLALALAVFLGSRMSHLDAEPIDACDENFGWFHPVFQSLLANQSGGFHQSPSCISEQNPVDGVVDVGGHTGGIQEAGL